jgi:hypothetical protein
LIEELAMNIAGVIAAITSATTTTFQYNPGIATW